MDSNGKVFYIKEFYNFNMDIFVVGVIVIRGYFEGENYVLDNKTMAFSAIFGQLRPQDGFK